MTNSTNYFHVKVKDITGDVEHFITFEYPEIDEEIGEMTIKADSGVVKYNLGNVIYYKVQEDIDRFIKEVNYEYDSI